MFHLYYTLTKWCAYRMLCVASERARWLSPATNESTTVCLPAVIADDYRYFTALGEPTGSGYLSSDHTSCTDSFRAKVVITTPAFSGGSADAVGSSFGHIGWKVDGVNPVPLEECDPARAEEASVCAYMETSEYEHEICLSPGRHSLELTDAMGYGCTLRRH